MSINKIMKLVTFIVFSALKESNLPFQLILN